MLNSYKAAMDAGAKMEEAVSAEINNIAAVIMAAADDLEGEAKDDVLASLERLEALRALVFLEIRASGNLRERNKNQANMLSRMLGGPRMISGHKAKFTSSCKKKKMS